MHDARPEPTQPRGIKKNGANHWGYLIKIISFFLRLIIFRFIGRSTTGSATQLPEGGIVKAPKPGSASRDS
jgi:hypothetical protein